MKVITYEKCFFFNSFWLFLWKQITNETASFVEYNNMTDKSSLSHMMWFVCFFANVFLEI